MTAHWIESMATPPERSGRDDAILAVSIVWGTAVVVSLFGFAGYGFFHALRSLLGGAG